MSGAQAQALVPISESGLTKKDRREALARLPVGTAPALRKLEAAMGGRGGVVQALLAAPLTEDVRYVLGLLADPRHDAEDLGTLCAMGGITPGELLQLYKSAAVAQAQIGAIAEMAAALPEVAADVMARARPHFVECPRCAGEGMVTPKPTKARPEPAPHPCRACKATGQVVQVPELDTQKVALELGGLINQKGGGVHLAVGISQTVTPGAQSTSFTALQREVDALLARPPVIDVVPEAEAQAQAGAAAEDPTP